LLPKRHTKNEDGNVEFGVSVKHQRKTMARARASSVASGTFLLLLCSAGAGHAQDAPAAAGAKTSLAKQDAAEANEEARDEILVTAHRQHGAVATDIPPEVSLNSMAIHALAAADLQEVFEDLAPEIGSGEGKAATPGKAPIVLVNGQRIAGFSSIKDLPPEAVRRIEIFPAEVALQYGYGADQRVVNVVLRSNYHALTLLGRYTLAPDNWRGLYRAKIDLIRIGENAHWNLALDYRHQDSIFADSTLAGPPAAPGDTTPVGHTLAAQNDHLTISGAATRNIGAVSAELTGSLDLDALQSRPGLSIQDGDLLAQEGLPDLVTGPLDRVDQTVDAQTNLTLNGKLDDGWRWSFIGKLDDTTRVTRTGEAPASGGLDTILLPSPGLLGHRCDTAADRNCVSTDTRQASGDFYLNGNLFSLPAGAVTAALRTGFAFSGIRSDSPLSQSIDRNRDEGNAQANLDFPITARDSALGKLSAGLNGTLRHLSDFGTLSTLGSTLDWSPIKPVSILASFSREQQAPTLFQLGEAALDTPDLREYDFATGATTIVQRIEGGNGDLSRQTSRIANVRLQVTPLRTTDLTLSAEYTIDRTRNPIANLTAATSAAMAAFPDRFTRDNGYLTALDVGPVNLARRDRQQVRMGLTYSSSFGPARSLAGTASTPARPPVRDQFQIALYDTWHLQDDAVLREGQRRLNLLGDDIISDEGGTPTHQIELQTTVSTLAWSADINAVWQTPTTASAGALSQERLTFSQGVTLNLRLQINLADQPWLVRRIPWLRGSLNLSADNLLGAHTKVHDSDGIVPAAYSESYLNPTGRTFRITLRKRFR
jgi:hypothetical protein